VVGAGKVAALLWCGGDMGEEFRIYRRYKLPHWRLDAATYYVTWRLAAAKPALTPSERDLVATAMRHLDYTRYELDGYVVMDDHIHVVLRPRDGWALEQILHSWKSFTANELGRGGRMSPIWQREYVDRIIRDEAELLEKLTYVVNNPLKRWPDEVDYRWVYPKGEG
jgi:putative transposase